MDAMPSQENPMMIQGEEPMDKAANIDLEKEPQGDDVDLAMMDEPQETGEESESDQPENEEPAADESAEFWSLD